MRKTICIFSFLSAVTLVAFLLPSTAHAAPPFATFDYNNPLNNVTSFTGWFSNLLISIQGIVGWLAVIMIVIGGVVYITSGGSVQQTTMGKSIVIYAMVGFAIAVAAPSLLREVRDIAAAPPVPAPGLISGAKPIQDIVSDFMDFLLTGIGMLALIGFVVGSILYISAGGDTTKAERGKKAALYSLIAICVSGAALIILNQVIALLET
ncbi:MAG: pilin [Patescibacteria group bacterium]|nr:pilin [Patescibacteria group bacterium]